MKNLALLALSAIVAFSMSQTASANTRTATRVLTESKVGQQIVRDFAVAKKMPLATQADINAAVQAFILAKGGEAAAGAAIIAKVDAISASSNIDAQIKEYARVSTKSFMQRELDKSAATARIDAQLEQVILDLVQAGKITGTEAQAAMRNIPAASQKVGHTLTGSQYVCSKEGCLSAMGVDAQANYVRVWAGLDTDSIKSEQDFISQAGAKLAQLTGVAVAKGKESLCYLAAKCQMFSLNSCPVSAAAN